MNRSQKRLGYVIAIAASALVLLIRLALNEALAEQARLMPFVLSVMAAAWWGGLGPGLLATALGFVLGLLFIVPPSYSLWVESLADGLNASIFLATGVTISFLCEALHAARRRETEKQFHTLADSIPQLVWMARPDGYRFWFNKRWYDYTGATAQQGEEPAWQSFHDPLELPRVAQSWNAVLAAGIAWEDTYPLRRRDGQMRWHLSRAVPVRDEQGEIVCWFGTNTDIQDRIEIERALKDADARKDQFLATLAHELRNPLSPLSNAIQLWPHVVSDKRELEQLRSVMERQIGHLIRLIDDLMDMSRITRGKINLRREPVDVTSLIAGAVETVQPVIDASGHQLTVVTPAEPVHLHGDVARLTQVLANILNNAAKYAGRNGVICIVAEKHGDSAVVRISDNGPGIPAHMLTEIFEPFLQVDSTLHRSHGGLGIGLTLARELVALHEGTIEARSEGPGKGSEFVVTLPALAVPPTGRAGGDATRSANSMGNLGRHTILVVDDLPEAAQTLALLLQSLGQDATWVDSGEGALEWILAHRPDAAFLDIGMPGLDGYEVARRLRENQALHNTVLVALTGYGQHEDRRRAFKAGFNFHMTKPTNREALEGLLRKLPASEAATCAARGDEPHTAVTTTS